MLIHAGSSLIRTTTSVDDADHSHVQIPLYHVQRDLSTGTSVPSPTVIRPCLVVETCAGTRAVVPGKDAALNMQKLQLRSSLIGPISHGEI